MIAFSINPDRDGRSGRRRRRAAYLEQYDRPGSERGWHFLDRRSSRRSRRWPRPSGFATRSTRRPSSTPTPRAWSSSRPTGTLPAIFTGSIFLPRSSRASSSEPGPVGSARRSAGCYYFATTTTRRPANTRFRSCGSSACWEPAPRSHWLSFMLVMFRREGKQRRMMAAEDTWAWPVRRARRPAPVSARRSRGEELNMWNFPLFPDQASKLVRAGRCALLFRAGNRRFLHGLDLRADRLASLCGTARMRSSIARTRRPSAITDWKCSGSACRWFWEW